MSCKVRLTGKIRGVLPIKRPWEDIFWEMALWNVQEESEEPAAAVHPMASSNGNLKLHRPWQLKWADSQGRTALYCEPAATDRELHFAGAHSAVHCSS